MAAQTDAVGLDGAFEGERLMSAATYVEEAGVAELGIRLINYDQVSVSGR